jgi:hypothetical protein
MSQRDVKIKNKDKILLDNLFSCLKNRITAAKNPIAIIAPNKTTRKLN